jgi:ubiquinone/menaquinone biosynthesis C-methylase UbiE
VERILEPEVMDDDHEAAAYDAMDFGEADRAFVDRALQLCGDRAVRRIVDLGCGSGTIALLLAERLPDAEIVGVDLAGSMLRLARRKISAAGLEARVSVVQEDVKGSSLGTGSFDLVLSNSTLHHLPDPQRLLAEMRRLGRAGAGILLVDLARPESPEAARAIVEAAAKDADDRQKRLFFESLCAALDVDELAALARLEGGLRDATVERCSSRHLRLERRATW